MNAEGERINPLARFDLGFFLRVLAAAVGLIALSLPGRRRGLERGSGARLASAPPRSD